MNSIDRASEATGAANRFAVVIPVYNHAARIADVVQAAMALALPVIVVDDGSNDGTTDILAGIAGIEHLRHRDNQGKGAALLTGFRHAAEWADWAVTIDGDGQHVPAEAAPLMSAALRTGRAIVVGRRTGMLGPEVPWTSRFGRGFSNFWVRAAGGAAIQDSQSGFRVYPLPEVFQLQVKARRFQFEVEVLAKAGWRGLPVVEVPVSVSYRPGTPRISHFRPFIDFCRNSNTFTRLIFQRIMVPGRIRRRWLASAPEPSNPAGER
jgi:glycosyltransferase involved in cell wall biosynthesis